MKTIGLFAWLLCLISMSALSQTTGPEYRPFAEDGKKWEIQVGVIKENKIGYSVNGDSLINGENWKKVYSYRGRLDFDRTYYAAIRDVGKKVYIIAAGSSRPRLLYDFGLKEGDIVKCGVEGNVFACLLEAGERSDTLLGVPFLSYLKVERIETITHKNLQHRRFILSVLDSYQEPLLEMNLSYGEDKVNHEYVIWIEGIGSGAGPFLPWMLLPPQNIIFPRCNIDEECIFSGSGFYENSGLNAINSPIFIRDENGFVHDLQGRRQPTLSKKGVYIHNGRKVVGR
jgi:hypothetical protein